MGTNFLKLTDIILAAFLGLPVAPLIAAKALAINAGLAMATEATTAGLAMEPKNCRRSNRFICTPRSKYNN